MINWRPLNFMASWSWDGIIIMQLYLVSFVLTTVITMPVGAEVGHIDEVNGLPSDFSLIRNNQSLPVAPYILLREGDKIEVKSGISLFKNEENSIQLVLNGRTIKVTEKNTPYLVTGDNIRFYSAFVGQLMKCTSQWLGKLYRQDVRSKLAMTRSGEIAKVRLSIPLLLEDNSKLLEGKRKIYLAWSGGQTPYQVSERKTGKPILPGKNISVRAIKHEYDLTDGEEYKIEVKDANANSVERTFQVTTKRALRSNMADVEREIQKSPVLDKNTKQILLATWFASQGREWGFEAYQQIAEMADTEETSRYYYPAYLVKLGIENNNLPERCSLTSPE